MLELGRLIPRDEQFFDLFDQLAAHLTTAAPLLDRALRRSRHRYDEHVRRSRTSSTRPISSDARRSTQRIDKSFVTPIDREDIHLLASRLDDVIDLHRRHGSPRRDAFTSARCVEPARSVTHVIVEAADHMQRGVKADQTKPTVRQRLRGSDQAARGRGGRVYHEAVGRAVRRHAGSARGDQVEGDLRYARDRRSISCMGVATALQSISIKNA